MARPKKSKEEDLILEQNPSDEALSVTAAPDQLIGKAVKKSIEIPDFDYRDLTGEKFKEYNDFTGKLRVDGHYDFILLKVNPVFVEKYPGMPNSPKEFIGVRAKTDIPEHTTRILLSHAIDYNRQILNDAAKRNGKYYLLKK